MLPLAEPATLTQPASPGIDQARWIQHVDQPSRHVVCQEAAATKGSGEPGRQAKGEPQPYPQQQPKLIVAVAGFTPVALAFAELLGTLLGLRSGKPRQ